MSGAAERCTVIVDARDRFSTTAACLRTLFANTTEPFDLIVVMGGAPEHLKAAWLAEFGDKGTWIFRPEFINQAQARNIGMRAAKTRLAVLMDSDNFVRPGWLGALVRCQQETGAALVVPVILETEEKIHTAGNDLYISYSQGKAHGCKFLRYHGMRLGERSNMKRRRTEYAELHCQLVEIAPTLQLNAYDEHILEVGEVDQGLVYAKAGREMWFEPEAVVRYALGTTVAAEDIRLFAWRWNIASIHDGYAYFERKWNLDISEWGTFRDWLVRYNSQVGLLPRLWPTALALKLDKGIGRVRRKVMEIWRTPKRQYRELTKRRLGYYQWTAGVTGFGKG